MDATQLGFQFAADLTKHLMTVSTAILAFSVTFAKDIAQTTTRGGRIFLFLGWSSYLLSLVFGIWTLMALTGTLMPLKTVSGPPQFGLNIRLPAALQLIAFLIGTGFIALFGVSTVNARK